MPKTAKPVDPESIAEMATAGQDVSRFFKQPGKMMPPTTPVQRVNVDFTVTFLAELDREASALNISRQAVIKSMLRDALDRRYLAKQQRA